jgi:tRNA(Glu) U13 pseudouridine synthase TruD
MRILEEEGVNLRIFRNKESRALDSPGGLHLVSMTVPDLEARPECEGLRLSFRLRKGSYATVVLRELMKNHPVNRT